MSTTFNKTILIGRLGCNPEMRGEGDKRYVKFTICNTTIKDGIEDVQFHNICAFGKQADLCAQYLNKGDLCCIEGRLDRYCYEKDGVKKESVSIIAEHITFLTSKRRTDEKQSETQANE